MADAGHEDVGRLQIAVDDAAVVRRGEPLGDLRAVLERLSDRQRPTRNHRRQGFTVEQFRHRVGDGALFPDVVNRDDVRIGKRGEGLHLALEPRERRWIDGENRRQHLDGDVAPEPRIARAVDFAHPTGANRADDFVDAETRAWGQPHYGVQIVRSRTRMKPAICHEE